MWTRAERARASESEERSRRRAHEEVRFRRIDAISARSFGLVRYLKFAASEVKGKLGARGGGKVSLGCVGLSFVNESAEFLMDYVIEMKRVGGAVGKDGYKC